LMALPDLTTSVKAGFGFFGTLLSPLPPFLKVTLGLGIFAVNYLCGLAALTATSRMMYAFARDGGLPASGFLSRISAKTQAPEAATWTSALLVVAATLYGDAFLVLSTGCVVLLYISYIMPTAAGILAEGKSWKVKGPFDLKGMSKPVAILAVLGGVVLAFVGIQPPNQKVLYLCLGLLALLGVFWWGFGVRKSFRGPPSLLQEDSEVDVAENSLPVL